jgi:MOSC domain-containing protein YiiM
MHQAVIARIFVASGKGERVQERERVNALAGAGLEGDRDAAGKGTFSKTSPGPDRHVTLIESEALAAVQRDYGIEVSAQATRRNLVTSGACLNHLVGRVFRVGEARLRGVELCEPCALLEKEAGVAGARGALLHRGGLRAEILDGGSIAVGDPIEEITP